MRKESDPDRQHPPRYPGVPRPVGRRRLAADTRLIADLRSAAGRLARGSCGRQSSRPGRREPHLHRPGQRGPGHVERIVRSAATADYDGRWTFDTAPSQRSSRHRQRKSRPERALTRSGSRSGPPPSPGRPRPCPHARTRHPGVRRCVHNRIPAQRSRRLPARARPGGPRPRAGPGTSIVAVSAASMPRPAKKCHEAETELVGHK